MLLIAALVFLQALNVEQELRSSLTAYAAIAIAALLLIAAARVSSQPNRLCLTSSAIFSSYLILRALTSPQSYVARSDLYLVLAELVIYGVVACLMTKPGPRIALITLLILCGGGHVVVGVVQTGFAQNYAMLVPSLAEVAPNVRGTGLYVDPDHLAGLLEILSILGLSLTCWSRRPGWVKVCTGYLTAICYFGLALTGSRGGYLSGAVSLLLFAVLSLITVRAAGRSSLVRYGGTGLLLLLVSCAGLWLLISQSTILSHQVSNIVTVDRGRLALWQAA
ncbi:MAG: hypothetical protein M3Y86_08170, partial [Verrucomicrobiota bacterium]|nr:hypothetical protein [Verrucomicrobiota bacterium]